MPRPPRFVTLGPRDAGRPVEKVLARALPGAAWSHVMKLLRRGLVRLEGQDERPLRRGDAVPGAGRLVIAPGDDRPAAPPMPNRRLRFAVLHADPDLAVVEKPAPLAMHPGPGHGTDTFLNALVGRFPELAGLGEERGWGLVHRLDRETSGLLVVARTAAARDALVEAFAARAVEKRYGALCLGRPAAVEGEVATPVDGKEALTRWRVDAAAGGVGRLTLLPRTGRTHQLRIHLASLGCPVLGDPRHGPAGLPLAARIGLERLALHAEALAFDHPSSGRRLAFESPWPPELTRAWVAAGTLR